MSIILDGTNGITSPAETTGAITATSITGLTTSLSVAQGGTGVTTLVSGSLVVGAGTSAVTGVAPGTSGNVLTSNGSAWTSASLAESSKIQSVTCTQGTGALTFGLTATTLDFRNTTLTNGAATTIAVGTLSLVLPSGGTLGFPTTIAGRMILVAINNAGTAELAVISFAGGNDLSETGVINTTAIGAGSTANNVFYSTTARTGVAYRVVGSVDATNTAGAWGNPTLVQGYGGQALAAMSSLGYGQTWQAVTRNSGTTYYNTTGKPILCKVFNSATVAGAFGSQFYVNGILASYAQSYANTSGYINEVSAVIPVGASYSYTLLSNTFNSSGSSELR